MATAAAASKPAARTTVNVAGAVFRVQMALLDGAAASDEPSSTRPRALPTPANPKAALRFHISSASTASTTSRRPQVLLRALLVASAAFAASLLPDRPRDPARQARRPGRALRGSGDGPGLGFRADGGKKGDEEEGGDCGEGDAWAWGGDAAGVDWPSGAIEGYVPRHHPIHEGPMPQAKQGKASRAELSGNKNVDSVAAVLGEHSMAVSSSSVETQVVSEDIAKKFDGMVLHENTKTKEKDANKTLSKIFQQDEDTDMLLPCITDSIAKQLEHVVLEERNDKKKKKSTRASSRASKSKPARKPAASNGHEVGFTSTIIMGDPASVKMDQGPLGQYDFSSSILTDNQPSSSQYTVRDSMHAYTEQLHKEFSQAGDLEKWTSDLEGYHCTKIFTEGCRSKNRSQSVTWEMIMEASKAYDIDSDAKNLSMEDIDSSLRRESAEACAAALIEAAGAISSGTSEVEEDAVSKAGIIILPDMLHQKQFENVHGKDTVEKVVSETDSDVVKWPTKTVLLDTDMFEVDDSWHDTPPEGFSLTLSAFATMWTTIFGWISRSSLAYVYMLDDSSVEEMLISNGREYPEKRVSKDSQSSEIKRALASCISNALPVLVSNMRMQIPVSKLETTLGYLIDTMSLVDALPALRSRQWQLLVLMLLDALSVHRLPALAPVISDSKLVQKILNSAQVSREEYDSMVDLILPFGRSA
ncbi:hypothetical protein ZWY2020_059249 [Hordeum vulgare]|nr:hypothetical protein ZWY2020_059249 [Hordeum vulgare]